jgi:hypothetical protein
MWLSKLVLFSKGYDMRLFNNSHAEKLQCPYKGCEKKFDKPTVITDNTSLLRENYYACPHCMSKLEIITEKTKVIEVKAVDYPTVFQSPAKCAHFSGNFNNFPPGTIPDECLICPKALQCSTRRK